MKLSALVIASVLLASCSSLPGPHSPEDSLVIGSFSMYFPGGFFDTAQSSLDGNIELDFRDVTTGHSVVKFLYNGHFAFLARGGDTYELVSSRANLLNGSRRYILGPRTIGLKIEPSPGQTLYLGNVTLTYTQMKDTLSVHPEVDYETIAMGSSAGMSPNVVGANIRDDKYYDVSVSQTWDDTALLSYMKKQDPSSPWLSRGVVDVKTASSPASPQ